MAPLTRRAKCKRRRRPHQRLSPAPAANDSSELRLRGRRGSSQGCGSLRLVRIDPADLEKIGAPIGHIILIEGERRTVAKVMPAYLPDRGKRLIQADGITRENAGASLDMTVLVERATAQPAQSVVLKPWPDRSAATAASRSISAGCWKAALLWRVTVCVWTWWEPACATSASRPSIPCGVAIVTGATRLQMREPGGERAAAHGRQL